jgi:hypothetical protein
MGIEARIFRRDNCILQERRNGGEGNGAPGLHLRTHDAADLLRFQVDRVQLLPGRGDQRHNPPVAHRDVYRAALAGGFFSSLVAEEYLDICRLCGEHPGGGWLSHDFPVGESLQSFGKAEVPEVVPLTDLRGAAVEDRWCFPGGHGNPSAYREVQVADVKQQGRCQGRKKISADQGAFPAASMKGRSVAIATMLLVTVFYLVPPCVPGEAGL